MSAGRIGIVGAGVTGLVLAHELVKRGVEVDVHESRPEPGGVIRTLEREGRTLELGPQRTRLTAPIRALVESLGIADELVTAEPELPLFVFRNGRLRRVPFSLGAAVRTNLISPVGKARVLLEPFMRGARPDESVADFLTRKFGREAYESMLGPLYGGLYASDPGDMIMRHTLSRALENFGIEGSVLLALARRSGGEVAPACSFRGGMRVLTDALHAAHRDRVRLSSPVTAIERDGDRYRVETPAGVETYDRVVLTVPADAAAELLRRAAPETADRLARLTYNPLAIVHLVSDLSMRGMGYQVAFGERLETRGVTFNASLFGREGVYTAFLGGARNPRLVEESDTRIGEIAAEEFYRVTGRAARVLHVARVRMPAWDRSWQALEGLEPPSGLTLAANYESRAGVPGRLARAAALARELSRAA